MSVLYADRPHHVDERGSYGVAVQTLSYNQLLNRTHDLLQQGSVPKVKQILEATGIGKMKMYSVFGNVYCLRATACSEWLEKLAKKVAQAASRRSLEGAVQKFVVELCDERSRGYILCLQELWCRPEGWMSLRMELEDVLWGAMFVGSKRTAAQNLQVAYHLDALLAMVVRDEVTPQSIRWSVKLIVSGSRI